MPQKKLPTVWEAEPHTIAKVAILKQYLVAWFSVLGRGRKGVDLLYVDGFAGPGHYANHPDGSPVAALRSAAEAIAAVGTNWRAGRIRCIFIEDRRDRYDYLCQHLEPFQSIQGVTYKVVPDKFVSGLNSIREEFPKQFTSDAPLLVFVDPFGATGAPFDSVKSILRSPSSEVIINFDADGIMRILHAGKDADRDRNLNSIFGDESWRQEIDPGTTFDSQCRQCLALYKRRLKTIAGVEYVFAFEMRSSSTSINYFLVFASKHPLGLEKMKEAMKRLDQDGSYTFSDAVVAATHLFRFDEPDDWLHDFQTEFRGKTVSYQTVNRYALNETPFVNPKAVLKLLELRGLISVESTDSRRRVGTFNEEKIVSIKFKEVIDG